MNKILLTGFYGEGNLGDETILKVLLKNIPRNIETIVTSGSKTIYKNTIRRRGLRSWPYFINSAYKCRQSIFSGGILQDWTAEGVIFFALRIIASSILKCPPSLWGAGIGPLRNEALKSLTAKALQHVNKAWMRDKYSLELFNALSPNRPGKLGADWSWDISFSSCSKKPEQERGGEYLINLRPWLHPTKGIEKIKAAEKQGRIIIGIPAREEDEKLLRKEFPYSKIFVPKDFSDLMTYCSSYKEGAAMRYHVCLAMMRAGIKTTVISYDKKTENLIEAGKDFKAYSESCADNLRSMKSAFIDEISKF